MADRETAEDEEALAGLPSSVQAVLRLIIRDALPEKVVLFGSRARRMHRQNSDFDFCVIGRSCKDEACIDSVS